MLCPLDGTELKITYRNDVEIDYCPKCRGVWLDRGEIDKIIERSALYQQSAQSDYSEKKKRKHHDDDDDQYRKHYKKKRKVKSFFEDLFDF